MLSLSGKKILVTGASSGIGQSIAQLASESGAYVVLMARRENALAETITKLKGSQHQYYGVDVTEDDRVKEVIKQAISDGVPFDGFVHSAGSELTVPLKLLSRNTFEKVLSVNAFAAFNIAKLLIQKGNLNPQGASFVFISSVMAALGQAAKIGYCASKGALTSGAKAMALELAPRNIRVNTILPGMVESEMSLELLKNLDEENVNKIKAMHPLGIGKVEDVAYSALYLLSDISKWVTGTSMFVDGGYSAH